MLTSEVSCVYSKSGRLRKVHIALFAPDLETATKINIRLGKLTNLAADGRIVLRTVKSNGQMVLTVANTGQTIPAADLPRIFDQFYRVEKSRSQAYGGSGLGLTIVKRIVELHGGEIEAASRDGWTTFTITLPDLSGEEI